MAGKVCPCSNLFDTIYLLTVYTARQVLPLIVKKQINDVKSGLKSKNNCTSSDIGQVSRFLGHVILGLHHFSD
jgi:hypothetical protein